MYTVGATGNYWGGHLDCQVLRAPQYLNPALYVKIGSGVGPVGWAKKKSS